MGKDVSHIPIVFYYYYNAFLYVSITTTLCGLPRYSPHVILWIIITLLILIQKDTTQHDALPPMLTDFPPHLPPCPHFSFFCCRFWIYYFYLTEFLMDSEICGQTREMRTRSQHTNSVRRKKKKKKTGIMRIHFLLSWSEYKSVGCWTTSSPVSQPTRY